MTLICTKCGRRAPKRNREGDSCGAWHNDLKRFDQPVWRTWLCQGLFLRPGAADTSTIPQHYVYHRLPLS